MRVLIVTTFGTAAACRGREQDPHAAFTFHNADGSVVVDAGAKSSKWPSADGVPVEMEFDSATNETTRGITHRVSFDAGSTKGAVTRYAWDVDDEVRRVGARRALQTWTIGRSDLRALLDGLERIATANLHRRDREGKLSSLCGAKLCVAWVRIDGTEVYTVDYWCYGPDDQARRVSNLRGLAFSRFARTFLDARE